MVKVSVLQDDCSNWFIVPITEVDDFGSLLERIQDDYTDYDAINSFNEQFGKYSTGGDINNYQLLISEEELKSMTNDV